MKALIEAIDLYKSFDNKNETSYVLEKLNLSIFPGTLTVIKGESGSGKTTLLNLLGTLDLPTKGKIFINGIDITKQTIKENDQLRKTKMGFIFQAIALVSTMTAYENIEIMLRVAGNINSTSENQIDSMLEKAGLGNRKHHRIQELSGGEQQRIAIIRALVHNPGIIFADEPTAELDETMSKRMVDWFISLVRDENKTIIMTTHDAGIIAKADQIIEIKKL